MAASSGAAPRASSAIWLRCSNNEPLEGTIGIGHTRWATHGRPSEINAHPHATDKVAIVHNGIIENFQELRAELEALGMRMTSETDTEVVAHLLTHLLECGYTPEEAIKCAMGRLKGAFSLAVLFAGRPDIMIGARRGSPLAVGYGDGEMFLGSDAMAIARLHRPDFLSAGGRLGRRFDGGRQCLQRQGRVDRAVTRTAVSTAAIGKGKHPHFMMKEIAEQPIVVSETLRAFFDPASAASPAARAAVRSRQDLAPDDRCMRHGSSGRACRQILAREHCTAAGGTRHRVGVSLSPSRRWMPTARSWSYRSPAKRQTRSELSATPRRWDRKVISVLNVADSTIGRESDAVLHTRAGMEIGVAATKTFTTQLAVLACLTIAVARARGA